MILTQITVSYGGTQSLPEYSNCKINISLTATIDPDDDPADAEAVLWQHAKESAHAQIDGALEANDIAAKYSTEPRYQVMQTYWNQWDHRGETKPPQYVIILPNDTDPERGAYAQRLIHAGSRGDSRKLRYAHALRIATAKMQEEDGYGLIDCSGGDLRGLADLLGVKESNPEVAPTADSPF